MFNNLLSFWKGKDFLTKVLEDFGTMLDDASQMYNLIIKQIIYKEETEGLKQKIYDIDQEINTKEKDVRKKIIEHLAIQPSVDVTTSLVLMSVVKDAERLGDYSKNLFEISELLIDPINKKTYDGIFGDIDVELAKFFIETKQAFIESDEALARKAWDHKQNISTKCDSIIESLSTCDLSVNEAVCYTLIARYFKRLSSHLTNISTSVIVPLADLDYYSENIE
jgi:phosphate transport system protein